MNTDGATTNFGAIQYHVVSPRPNRARVMLQKLNVLITRGGKRVVCRLPATAFAITLDQRKIDHPKRLPTVLNLTQVMTQANPECTQRIINHLLGIRTEKKKVTITNLSPLHEGRDHLVWQKFQNR